MNNILKGAALGFIIISLFYLPMFYFKIDVLCDVLRAIEGKL